ncbi:MAG: DeoR/GlpR transcriptional regulator [Clostridia bacterium]|nr:DeoR/GlpR transcriptional regulator [Clostridia bacterium]
MFALERQKKILELLSQDGAVFVTKLSVELGVTEETVRRDLEKLEKQEALVRTHGGAMPIVDSNRELSLEKRKNINVDAKIRLAKEAINYIVSGDTVFLDASTTTFYIAKELKNMKNVTIVTNSIRVINELAGNPNLNVIAIGGYASDNQSLVGSIAQNDIANNYFANKMFFSSRGMTESVGILESNEQECGIKQAMMKNSEKKYYVCDHSKIGRVGFAKLAQFTDVDYVIVEGPLEESFKKVFEDIDTKLVEI